MNKINEIKGNLILINKKTNEQTKKTQKKRYRENLI